MAEKLVVYLFFKQYIVMRSIYIFLLVCVGSLGFSAVQAQNKPAKSTITPVKKFKAPKLYSFLGNLTDSVKVSVMEAQNILGAALRITDDKKNVYTVTYYEFLYKRRVVTEDETTGKTSPASSIVANHFTSSPLPKLWLSTIREQLIAGEELYFYDIIVKDAAGRVMYAPSIKILTK